ncbi:MULTISPECIES: hypothetical protein [unclassified Wenzhouxiangella]|nr:MULTISPECIES: hypothetical protein [unclassified Wenzhouxiangella]
MSDQHDPEGTRARRRRAVRTALLLAAVVFMIYLGFILSGVLKAG